MFRWGVFSGVLATILAVVLLTGVRSFRVTAVTSGRAVPCLTLNLPQNAGSPALQPSMLPRSFPGLCGVLGHSGCVHQLVFDEFDESLQEIPEGADVELTHLWVNSRGTGWNFGCTQIVWSGRSYVVERSRTWFFTTLALIAAAPVLLWGMVALASVCFRPRKQPI